MRTHVLTAALLALACTFGGVSARAGGSGCSACSGGGMTDCNTCGCGNGPHICFQGRGYPGLDRHFQCGCNGSYKFPVPPLYTYHWPGLYSHQLMTEYHSPWRFPPIKAYQDEKLEVQPDFGPQLDPKRDDREPLPPAAAAYRAAAGNEVRAVDHSTPGLRPGQTEPVSVKLQRVSRYTP